MKNTISKLIICGLVLGYASSCNLDRFPIESISEDTFYVNQSQVESALNGAYAVVRSANVDKWKWTELRSDNAAPLAGGMGGTSNQAIVGNLDIACYNYDDLTTGLNSYFKSQYVLINRANIVVAKAGVISDENIKNKIVAEAKALRSMAYFDLARLFGDVWYVTTAISGDEALAMEKSSADDIITNIVADLEESVANLPKRADQPSSEIGRFNQEAARTLLAYVYLTQKDYAKVKSTLAPVVATYGTDGNALVPFDKIFSTENEMNEEIFFAVRNMTGNLGLGSTYANLFSSTLGSNPVIGGGAANNAPTDDIIRLFGNTYDWGYSATTGLPMEGQINNAVLSTTDKRSPVTVSLFGDSQWVNCKYYETNFSTKDDSEADFPLLRYADALLMMAEAENELGNTAAAAPYVNAIRTRAGLAPISIADATEMHAAILQERRLEFAFENKRYFDLLREGSQVLLAAIDHRNTNEVYSAYTHDYCKPYSPKEGGILLPLPFEITSLY